MSCQIIEVDSNNYSFFNSRETYYLNKNIYYFITGLQKAVLILF